MPRGVYERKPTKEIPDMASETPAGVAPKDMIKLFPVVLNKNYQPAGVYEIVGYLKEAVKRKDAAGNWKIVEPEEFVQGEMKPHKYPGVGYEGKIWAGTHIRLPVEEAKRLVNLKAADRADAIAA